MKFGTLTCKLFGHKFVYSKRKMIDSLRIKRIETTNPRSMFYDEPIKTDYCVRCGIKKINQ